MNKKYQLVIFDMDGLMFDTERIAWKGWKKSSDIHGFKMDKSQFVSMIGKTEQDILEDLREIYGDESEIVKWRQTMQSFKKDFLFLNKVPIKEGLVELLNYLKSEHIACAVATSNERLFADKYLEDHQLFSYFKTVITQEDIKKGKPNPEIFLKACQKLSIEPQVTLVLEDSSAGVKAAINGGMDVYYVIDMIDDQEMRKKATRTFNDLKEVLNVVKGAE